MIERFVFSGSGGQGVITAAIIMAEAALHYEGLHVVQTQTYGPEARGGAARADVIVSDEEIYFPRVLEPNVLVCLSQRAYDRYTDGVRPGGIIVLDPFFVHTRSEVNSRQVPVPVHESVVAEFGSSQAINMCMLGAVSRLIPLVSLDALKEISRDRFDERFEATNLRALEIGYALVTESVGTF